MGVVPVVSGDRASVFHTPPASPGLGILINFHIPDLLAPNDIFDFETRVVVHDPLGNSPTNGVTSSNHEVKG